MMRQRLAAAAAALFVFAACSGAPSNPTDFCNQVSQVVCHRIFDCALGTAQTLYGTEDDCRTKFEANLNCGTAQCPAGTTYNPTNAQTCIDDLNGEACTDVVKGTIPALCLATGPGDPCQ